jgi:hypothetical protein
VLGRYDLRDFKDAIDELRQVTPFVRDDWDDVKVSDSSELLCRFRAIRLVSSCWTILSIIGSILFSFKLILLQLRL